MLLTKFSFFYGFSLMVAIILEVAANLLMKLSQGFTRKYYALSAIGCALIAFTALSFAIQAIPLSIAYSIWGGIGLIATAIMGMQFFGEKVEGKAWLGMGLIIVGLILMKKAFF